MGDAMTKRRAAFGLLALVCTACTQPRVASPPAVDEMAQIGAADALQYDSARVLEAEAGVLALTKGVARRERDTLILTREFGHTVELADTPTCQRENYDVHCVRYRLAAWLPSRHAFVVDALRYEGGSYLLIDGLSGDRLEIASPPHFSPDGTRFATFDNDEESAADGIRIWTAHGASYVSEWNMQRAAGFVRWDGNDRLLVKFQSPPGGRHTATDREAALVRSGAGWKLEPDGRKP
jgi:hypothetical protein